MTQIMPIRESKNTSPKKQDMYSDIELSEKQIKEGKTKNARNALSALREKCGL